MSDRSGKLTIEEEITKIKKELESVERNDYEWRQWSDELKQLRHLVMYTHSVIENILISMIASEVLKPVHVSSNDSSETSKESITNYIIANNRMTFLLDEMEFANKLRVIEKLKLLPEEKGHKLFEKLQRVNRIRNMFSHPTAYVHEINEYKNRTKYRDIIKFLRDTLHELMTDRISSITPS